MTIVLKPEQEKAIQAAIEAGMIQSVDEFIESAIGGLSLSADSRADAIRKMEEFGDTQHLNLGERITRKLLHEGHRV